MAHRSNNNNNKQTLLLINDLGCCLSVQLLHSFGHHQSQYIARERLTARSTEWFPAWHTVTSETWTSSARTVVR